MFVPLAAITRSSFVLPTSPGRWAPTRRRGAAGSAGGAVRRRPVPAAPGQFGAGGEAAPATRELLAAAAAGDPGHQPHGAWRRRRARLPVPPLALPADPPGPTARPESGGRGALSGRARAVRPRFALTVGDAERSREICRRLDGLPLAIELAAARAALDRRGLLGRLAASLDALGTGAVDLPERQRTLRATVECSVGLLDDDERSLMETVAVFTDGWTIGAAAQVAGRGRGPGAGVVGCAGPAQSGPARHQQRHVPLLPDVGDRPSVRGRAADGPPRCSPRLSADTPITTARWPSRRTGRCAAPDKASGSRAAGTGRGGEPGRRRNPVPDHTTPRRCRTCSASCIPSGSCGTVRLRPAPGWKDWSADCRPSSNPTPVLSSSGRRRRWPSSGATTRAELAALRDLAPLLAGIEDPFLHAVSELAIAWALPITGDFEGALREVSASLEELRGQDEPLLHRPGWTSTALRCGDGLRPAPTTHCSTCA